MAHSNDGFMERRRDVLTRDEFLDAFRALDKKFDTLTEYQRQANGKVATAFEKLATLEERTQNMKDGRARSTAVGGLVVAIISVIIGILKGH